MMKIDFQEEFERLVKWFRMERNMTPENAAQAFEKIKYYPAKGLKYAVDYMIEAQRPMPGNFPTINEIINLIMKWLDMHPAEKFERMTFDTDNDPTYPISKLWDGYRILMDDGEQAFFKFAKDNRMPLQDIERVRNKANAVHFKHQVDGMVDNVGKDIPF